MAHTIFLSPSRVGAVPSELRLVTFVLNYQTYAVDVADVQGIYHGLPLIPTPDSPPFLEGDVQLAGSRIPVVNLRRFSGLGELARAVQPRWILLVRDGAGVAGVLVDKVSEVVMLPARGLKAASGEGTDPLAGYVVAEADHQGRRVLLPDLGRLVQDATRA